MTKFLLRLLPLSLLALLPAAVFAQGAWQTFLRPLTIRDVLAEPDTVWLGTGEAGVVRYTALDGRFTSFTRDPAGLSSNDISALARDRAGNLWVGTNGGGVSRLSPNGAWRVFNQFDGVPSDSINCLTADGDTVWIGSTAGIAVWDGTAISGRLPDGFSPSPFSSDNIVGIVRVGDSLWVFNPTDSYSSRISTGLASWTSMNANLPSYTTFGAAVSYVTDIIAMTRNGSIVRRSSAAGAPWAPSGGTIGYVEHLTADHGTVLAVSETGLYRLTAYTWANLEPAFTSDRNTPETILAAAKDPSGKFWAANVAGLYESLTPVPGWTLHALGGPPGNDLFNVALHRGRVYVTAGAAGVGRYDGQQWRNWVPGGCNPPCDYDTSFISPSYTFTLFEDRQGYLWFAPWGTSVSRLDDSGSVPSFVHYFTGGGTNAPHTKTVGATADSSGGRWFGTDTNNFGDPGFFPIGLEYYNANGTYTSNYDPATNSQILGGRIHALTTDRGGQVWLGSLEGGLQRFVPVPSPAVVQFEDVPNTRNLSVRAVEAKGDTVYVMTSRDVRLYSRFSAAFIDSFLLPAVPPVIAGHPLLVASDGTVYVGSANGVRARKLDGSIQDLTTANTPLASDEVRGIREERGTGALWIATGGGLHRYDPRYRAPEPPPPPSLTFRIYPNPSSLSALGVSLRIAGNASRYDGEVYDLTGRVVHRFRSSGTGQVMWDGRDREGNLVHPGIYFLKIVAGTDTGFARIVLLH